MKIIVTGAGGFVGGYVASHLAKQGHKVEPWTERGLKAVAGADVIVHCAASGPWRTDEEIFNDNISFMYYLVTRAKVSRVKKFIFMSSICAYGTIIDKIVDEQTAIRNPAAYGRSKLLGEYLLAASGLPSVSLRMPGIVGPGCHSRNWLPSVVSSVIERKVIGIYNSEFYFNAVVHVADVAAFVERLLEAKWNGHERLALGSLMDKTTVHDVVCEVVRAIGMPQTKIIEHPVVAPPYLIDSHRAMAAGYIPMPTKELVTRFALEYKTEKFNVGRSGA